MPINHSDLKQVQSNIEKQISRQTQEVLKKLEEIKELIKDEDNE